MISTENTQNKGFKYFQYEGERMTSDSHLHKLDREENYQRKGKSILNFHLIKIDKQKKSFI